MISTKVQYFEKLETAQHKDYVQDQGHCVLCRTELKITHTTQSEGMQIKEEAHCSECDVRARAKVYTLN